MTVVAVIGTLPSFHSTDVGKGMRGGWDGGAASALCVTGIVDNRARQMRAIMILSGEAFLRAYVRTIP
jgi:hypothetical protein